MKNLKKIFAIALSVATVAMSTSAFAATYDAEATSVALTAEEIATLDSYAGQMTVVVVPKTFGETSTAADIYYINQDDAAAFEAIIADMGVKAALDGETEWEVRIGGENVAEVVTFDITVTTAEPEPAFSIGDVNRSGGNADVLDASDIVRFVLGAITFDDEQKVLGDVNKSGGNPDVLDASDIVRSVLGAITLG